MVNYIDEQILKKREELKKQRHVSLENGFYVEGKILNFTRKELFSLFSIYLPDSMRDMPDLLAKIKYPSEFRPGKILTTLDLSVNMGFSVLWDQLETKNIRKLTDRMMSAIHRSNSDFRFYALEDMEQIGGCYFAFRSHAMDSDLYNMMLMVPIGNEIVQCSFNCLYKNFNNWKPVVLLMWKSIEMLKEKEIR